MADRSPQTTADASPSLVKVALGAISIAWFGYCAVWLLGGGFTAWKARMDVLQIEAQRNIFVRECVLAALPSSERSAEDVVARCRLAFAAMKETPHAR
jgi:hypothetical protein